VNIVSGFLVIRPERPVTLVAVWITISFAGIVCGIWAAAVLLSILPLIGWNNYVYEVSYGNIYF
jgi:hypothetical protein